MKVVLYTNIIYIIVYDNFHCDPTYKEHAKTGGVQHVATFPTKHPGPLALIAPFHSN